MATVVNPGTRILEDTDIEFEKIFHLVLLDNGRSRILASEYAESLACIRCGACMNICPVYQNVGGHAYGAVYPGPIGSIVTPLLNGLSTAPELPQASSLCGACSEVCPVGIPIPELLMQLRRAAKHDAAPGQPPLLSVAALELDESLLTGETVSYDGKDKVGATNAIAVSRMIFATGPLSVLAYANATAELAPGQRKLTLNFSGEEIWANGGNGRFTLADLRLNDMGAAAAPLRLDFKASPPDPALVTTSPPWSWQISTPRSSQTSTG